MLPLVGEIDGPENDADLTMCHTLLETETNYI